MPPSAFKIGRARRIIWKHVLKLRQRTRKWQIASLKNINHHGSSKSAQGTKILHLVTVCDNPISTVDTIDLPAGLIAEQPPAMVAAQVLADRIAQLKADLSALDFKKIRPLAEGDAAYLATLNAQSATLRAELATL
jgi:hypothetical protein